MVIGAVGDSIGSDSVAASATAIRPAGPECSKQLAPVMSCLLERLFNLRWGAHGASVASRAPRIAADRRPAPLKMPYLRFRRQHRRIRLGRRHHCTGLRRWPPSTGWNGVLLIALVIAVVAGITVWCERNSRDRRTEAVNRRKAGTIMWCDRPA